MDTWKLTAAALAFCTLPLHAATEYIADGEIEASVCSGVIFKKCTTKKVVAFSNGDGKIYDMPRSFNNIDETRNGMCWINTNSNKITTKIINSITAPSFLHQGRIRFKNSFT